MALRWDWIDSDTRIITVDRAYCRVLKADKSYTKSGKIRNTPISNNLNEILVKLKIETYLELHGPRFTKRKNFIEYLNISLANYNWCFSLLSNQSIKSAQIFKQLINKVK